MNKYIHEIINNLTYYNYYNALQIILESKLLSLEEIVDIVISDACETDIYDLICYILESDLSSKECNKLIQALMHMNTNLANKYLVKLLKDNISNKEEIINYLIENGDYSSLTTLYLDLESIFEENKLKLDYLECVKKIWHTIFLQQEDYYSICCFLINQKIYSQKNFRIILETSNRAFIEFFKKYLDRTQELPDINGLTNALNYVFFQSDITSYSNDELFNYLINLCQKRDISTINKNKEIFKAIFTPTENKELHK